MFNIRVYGILIDDDKNVLVSDELIKGNRYTKFCGGGLEHGEGTINCLKREFLEEMDLEIEVVNHLYTTDFYQKSFFNPNHQLISIYYQVQALEPIKVSLKKTPFEYDEEQMIKYQLTQQVESFRFISWELFSAECMTLPIDKIAAKIVKQQLLSN
jgi:8-oxo-dGTP diphosphatase